MLDATQEENGRREDASRDGHQVENDGLVLDRVVLHHGHFRIAPRTQVTRKERSDHAGRPLESNAVDDVATAPYVDHQTDISGLKQILFAITRRAV